MKHEVELLVLAKRGAVNAVQVLDNLHGAQVDAWILGTQRLHERRGVGRGSLLIAIAALDEILQVENEARVVLRAVVDMKAERALNDAADVLDHRCVAGRAGLRARSGAGVDEVKCDARRLLLGQTDAKALVDEAEGVFADLGLLLVQHANVVVEGHVEVHVALEALDGKGEVVGEGKDHAGIHEVTHAGAREVDDLGGDLQHLLGDVLDRVDVNGVDVVEGALDAGDVYVVGRLGKADALAKRNNLLPTTIEADGDVVVDVLDDTHEKTPHFPPVENLRKSLGASNNPDAMSDSW